MSKKQSKSDTVMVNLPGTHLAAMKCNRCGETVPMPLGLVDWVVGVTNAFNKAHRYCTLGGRRTTYFVTDNAPPMEKKS